MSLPFIGTLCGLIVPFRPFKDFLVSLNFSPFLLYIVHLLFNVLTICHLASTFKPFSIFVFGLFKKLVGPDYPIFSFQGPVRTFPKNLLFQLGIWWNKESEILRTYLKYFSLEKYIGVCRKEDVSKHTTSPRQYTE